MTDFFFDVAKELKKGYIYNFFTGNRGCGKTYSWKRHVINNFLSSDGKNQFVYARRYATEIEPKKLERGFFTDIAKEFPEHSFAVDGDTAYIDGKPAGFFLAVSRGVVDKGTSAYDNVTDLLFDEFILAPGTYHYIRNECEAFEDLLENVFRLRDARICLFSNNISEVNPYFLFYGIKFTRNSPNVYKRDGLRAMKINQSDYTSYKASTGRAKVIAGTNYFKSTVYNEALSDDRTNIDKKPSGSVCKFVIIVDGVKIGAWKAPVYGKWYLSPDIVNCGPFTFEWDLQRAGADALVLNYKHPYIKTIMQAFQAGTLFYETQTCKNLFMKIAKRT